MQKEFLFILFLVIIGYIYAKKYNKDNNIETFIHGHKLTNQEKSLIKKFRQPA